MSQAEVFQSFNEQLACIADAGIPLQEGLRLIAQETRSRKGRNTLCTSMPTGSTMLHRFIG